MAQFDEQRAGFEILQCTPGFANILGPSTGSHQLLGLITDHQAFRGLVQQTAAELRGGTGIAASPKCLPTEPQLLHVPASLKGCPEWESKLQELKSTMATAEASSRLSTARCAAPADSFFDM